MIDDDEFQKIFRKMMEQFFGTFGMPNGGNSIGGLWDEQTEDIRETEMDLTHHGSHGCGPCHPHRLKVFWLNHDYEHYWF